MKTGNPPLLLLGFLLLGLIGSLGLIQASPDNRVGKAAQPGVSIPILTQSGISRDEFLQAYRDA
jgi:hypothetical protein